MPSTPLTCCSIGAATVSATTLTSAPGYRAVTWTVGGVISGYSATGRRAAAMPPSRTMMTEMTHARTGRSMKNRASTAGPLSGFFGLPGVCRERDRHVHEFRLDRDARPHLLQPVDDHLLARLQAVGDLAQTVMKCSQPDGAGDHLVLLVDNVEDLLALIGVEGALADQQRLVGPANGTPDAGEQPGDEDLLLVGERAAKSHGADPRVHLVVHEVNRPLMRVTVFIGQPQPHRDPALAGRVHLAFADQLPDTQHRVLVHVEVGVHRVHRHDRREQGAAALVPRLHQVTHGDDVA